MAKKKLIIVGAHGSGEIAMTVFEDINKVSYEWDIQGYINDVLPVGSHLGKYKVIGPSESILDYVNKGFFIHYTYHFNSKKKRERVESFIKLNIPLEANATGIHPLAYVNQKSKIGFGCLLLPFSATSASSEIGNSIHLYTNSFVGHNSIIGDFSTLAAHSVIGARNIIDIGAHVGLNSSTREDIKLGKFSVIGMCACVIHHVRDFSIVIGNPAREINTAEK